jgi:hypothetical protein
MVKKQSAFRYQLSALGGQFYTAGYRPGAIGFMGPSLQPVAYSLKPFLFLLKADC